MGGSNKRLRRITPPQVIMLGFLCLILFGALLLMLPVASKTARPTPFLDALFTSVSATCVTGLIVYDTYSHWSLFGQAVILCLIQAGGMGVVTVAVCISRMRGKRIGLRQRVIMQESISAFQMGGIVRMTAFIVKYVLLIEGIGAVLLALRFCPRLGLFTGLWYAVFHSVSAFCNAGFDLMGRSSPFSSLTGWAADPLVNLTIMLLIVIGGIGFLTWADVRDHKLRFSAYKLQTKLVLVTSALLLALPALFFLLYEFRLPQWAALSGGEKFLGALFQTVTARTAGFNTVDLAALSHPSLLLMMCLMLVGGSPGSTAGGFKTTALAALFLSFHSTLRGRSGVQAFGRRLEDDALSRATLLIFVYVMLALAGGVFLCIWDGVSLIAALFETCSAVATVGVTLGITPELSAPSHLVLIFLMYLGRVGGLTMIYGLAAATPSPARMPQEHITIG